MFIYVYLVCVHMSSVNISIKKEAYEFLGSLKTKNKSFSDVILEFKENKFEMGNTKSLLRFAGVLKDVDWDEREKRMKEFRDSFNKRIKKTTEYMEKNRK